GEDEMTKRLLCGGLMLLALTAGAYGEGKGADSKATGVKHAGLERMKKVAGAWVEAGQEGKPTDKGVAGIKVSGGGSGVERRLCAGRGRGWVWSISAVAENW